MLRQKSIRCGNGRRQQQSQITRLEFNYHVAYNVIFCRFVAFATGLKVYLSFHFAVFIVDKVKDQSMTIIAIKSKGWMDFVQYKKMNKLARVY